MFTIAIVLLIVLFPVLVPAAVTAVGAIADTRERRPERIADSLGVGVGSIGGQSISNEHARRAAVS